MFTEFNLNLTMLWFLALNGEEFIGFQGGVSALSFVNLE